MIDVIFSLGTEVIMVRVLGFHAFFRTMAFGGQLVPIDNLKLNKVGVIREHPDLENDPEWRTKSIQRFKEHLKKLNSEITRMNYIIDELNKYGYKAIQWHREGHRSKKL